VNKLHSDTYGKTIAVNKLHSDTFQKIVFLSIEQGFGTSNDDHDDDENVMTMVLVVMVGCKEQRH
jgi:hypothetical protein